MMVVGGFWLLARGVVGDSESGTATSSTEPSLGSTVALGGCAGDPRISTDSDDRAAGEAGGLAPTPPLTLPLLRKVTSAPWPQSSVPLSILSSPAAGFLSCAPDGLPVARPAAVIG
jgi:hypothetical protein